MFLIWVCFTQVVIYIALKLKAMWEKNNNRFTQVVIYIALKQHQRLHTGYARFTQVVIYIALKPCGLKNRHPEVLPRS